MDLRDMGKPGNQGSLGVMEAFVDMQGRGLWGHLETMDIRGPGGIWRAGAPVYLETVGDLSPWEPSRKSAGFYILVHPVEVFEDFVTGSGACHL